MGWDFTLTPYDAARWDEIATAGPAALAALLDAAVPEPQRDPFVVESLNSSDSAYDWRRVACADVAAAEKGAFLGRTMYLERFAKAARARSTALAAALKEFADAVEPLLSEDGDAELIFMRLAPDRVTRLAGLFRALEPRAIPLSPGEVTQQVMLEGFAVSSFEVWALGPFASLVTWSAARGLGLIASHDELPSLRADKAGEPGERHLMAPPEFAHNETPPDAPPSVARAPLRGGTVALVLTVVLALLILVAWLQLRRG
jgi:hypothetical protein